MFNITNFQRNANQSYNVLSPHTRQNDHHQNVYKQYIVEKVWRKGNRPTLMWECKLSQPLWGTVWRLLRKLKIELPYDLEIPLLGLYLEKTMIRKITCTPKFFAALFKIANMEAT